MYVYMTEHVEMHAHIHKSVMHRYMYTCTYVCALEMHGHRLGKTKTHFYSGHASRKSGVRRRDIYRYYLISNHSLNFLSGGINPHFFKVLVGMPNTIYIHSLDRNC